MPRRRRRSSSLLLILLLCVVAVPVLAFAAVYGFVDPNGFKPRIAEAVHAATGRDFAIDGPLRIRLSLSPTLQATDVHLANPPGFSRPDLASVAKVDAHLGLWALLQGRVEIVRLTLTAPDVLLETNAGGQVNWRFAPPARSQAPAPAAASQPQAPGARGAPRFAVGEVAISGGRMGWRDARDGRSEVADIKTVSMTSSGEDGPISAAADIRLQDHDVALTAETGPLSGLMGGDPNGPGWKLQLVGRVDSARFAASGTINRPLEGRGYALTLDAAVPDLGPLGQLLGRKLPALRDVSASAKVTDATGAPVLSALMLHAGASDLGDVAPTLSLERLAISAAGLDQPMQAELDGKMSGTPLHATASLGAPGPVLPGLGDALASGAPFPIDIALKAGGATVTAKGGIAAPAQLQGLDLVVSARVPSLAALAPLVGRPLPDLHDLAFDGRISDAEGGYAKGLVLRGASLSGPEGDLAGDLTVAFRTPIAVQGQLSGKRLNLDALQAALAAMPKQPAQAAPSRGSAASPPPSAAAPAMPAPAKSGPRLVFSDRPIDLGAAGLIDGDLRLAVAEIILGGVSTRDLSLRLQLDHGKVTIDPFAATLPGGKLDLKLSADTQAPEPPLTLTLSVPGIALKPLLTALALPDDVSGTAELAMDVTAAGRTPHALAASLSGRLGLAMIEGELDNRLLASLVEVLRVAKLPADLVISGAGRTRLRCFAARIDATHGMANVATIVLDTSKVLVQGAGVVNLGDEAVDLRLRPMIRTGGPGIVVPVRVGGSLSALSGSVDGGGALKGVAGGLTGGLAGLARSPLAALTGTFTGERGGDACGPAMAAARGARPGTK